MQRVQQGVSIQLYNTTSMASISFARQQFPLTKLMIMYTAGPDNY